MIGSDALVKITVIFLCLVSATILVELVLHIGPLWLNVDWYWVEAVEFLETILAVSGLIIGLYTIIRLRGSNKRLTGSNQKLTDQVKVVSGEFNNMMQDKFDDWELTPSEKDVALFTIKGMTIQEIAELRKKSVGTIKFQSNSIYKKAGVANRTQLVSYFIEELTSPL